MTAYPMPATQPMLFAAPIAGVYPIGMGEANELLVRWEHRLGPINRPFRSEAYALMLDQRPVAVAVSTSIVNGPVAGYERQEVVELGRLCAEPGNRWANRVMLRVWREVAAPRWKCWPVKAAVSYSHNAMHRGDILRTDGWTKVRDDCGSSGGGLWSRKREQGEAVYGSKSLWVWIYENPRTHPAARVGG